MKMKKFFAAAAAFAICANMAACGSTSDNTGTTSETDDAEVSSAADNNSDTSSESKNVTLCESWTFDAGFYAVVHGGMSSNYGISYWGHNFYDTLVVYEDGEYKGSLAENGTLARTARNTPLPSETALNSPTELPAMRQRSKRVLKLQR